MTTENEVRQNFFIVRESDTIIATQATQKLAREIGFNLAMQSMIATAVSELGTNIIKYAGRGYILIGKIRRMKQEGIEIIAEDSGPGLPDIAGALTDSFSTGESLGLGLPGVKRLMDEFLIDSNEGCGTKIVAKKWKPLKC